MKELIVVVFSFLFLTLHLSAKVEHLLPTPKSIVQTETAGFTLGRTVTITDTTECVVLEEALEEMGCTITEEGGEGQVVVQLADTIDGAYDYELTGFENEAYALIITPDTITIRAVTATGVIRAAQTLTQLAESENGTVNELEAVEIVDWPAFKLRGYMHDVGRSWISFDELKKEIRLFARFKINVFHWHLTENQAWRFEVQAYPELTAEENMTRFAGYYYTQDQCRELEAYAAERGVMIIPEIDMPGHSDAFESAMGHSMQTDEGVEELKVILSEVADVFSSAPYIHIGADEETITYSGFLQTITDHVHSLGKSVVVWNPISGVTITTSTGADMTQMWSTSGAAIDGLANIDCRYNYTNHFDVFADLVGIYKSNVYYQSQGDETVAGLISAAWNDRKMPDEEYIIRQNNIYANIIASGERGWKGGGEQYIEVGGTTLPNTGSEYEEFADWERRFLFHKANSLSDESIPYVKQTNIRWKITDAFPNGGDADLELPPETEGLCDSYELDGTTYNVSTATGGGIYLRHTWGTTVPAFFSNPQTNTTAYAWTYVYSETARTVGALIEFQNYGRSEVDTAPEEGCWDRKGSRLWVNDEEIAPPTWDNTGVTIGKEVDLLNENFTGREPTRINLIEGWNKVFMKLPYNPTSGVRLTKWMFTFVLTDTLGNDALDDVIYSPNMYLDTEAETVASAISDALSERNEVIGTEPGYYSEEVAAELDSVIAAIQATLTDSLTNEERTAQVETLDAALQAFLEAIDEAEPIFPTEGTAYTLCTPLRDGRYLTGSGEDAIVYGTTAISSGSCWQFVLRDDGTYDIVNCDDGTYISPSSSYNTAIYTVADRPEDGWTLTFVSSPYFIITCGTVQLNQTNSSLSYKLYNWGNATNTTDTGCLFVIETADYEEVEIPEPDLTLVDLEFDGSGPYRVPDDLAAPVLSTNTLSVAVDFTQAASTSDPTLLTASSDEDGEDYFGVIVRSSDRYGIQYIGDNDIEGYYTSTGTFGTTRAQVVITMEENDEIYYFYLNGSLSRSLSGMGNYGYRTFANVPGVSGLYIGGVVTGSDSNYLPFTGTIHSVRYWSEVLTESQVAALKYTNLTSSVSGLHSVQNNSNGDNRFYDLQGRRVNNPQKGIYILGGRKIIK